MHLHCTLHSFALAIIKAVDLPSTNCSSESMVNISVKSTHDDIMLFLQNSVIQINDLEQFFLLLHPKASVHIPICNNV